MSIIFVYNSKSTQTTLTKVLTLSFPLFHFDPPKNIRKPKVFWFFQEDQKATLERKWLNNIGLTYCLAYDSKHINMNLKSTPKISSRTLEALAATSKIPATKESNEELTETETF